MRGDGDVEFEGTSGVLVTGHHRGHISEQAVRDLLAAFRRANYFSLKDKYVFPATDAPTYTTSIEFDGIKKSVRDYVGLSAGMPEIVPDLEDAIDRIAGTEKWIKGNAETPAALVAEGWDFRADTQENRALFARVVAHGSQELIDLFVTHGAPALGMTEEGQSALASAAGNGNFELVKLMLKNQPKPPAGLLSCALGEAARSGNLDLVEFLIDKNGDVNGPPCGKYDTATALMKATQSGKADVVEEILKYHPDVEAKDINGYTALAYFLERPARKVDTQKIVSLLLAAGADANSRDTQERTPLFYACMNQHPDAVRILVAAGADVNAKDRSGQTVLMSCFGNRGVKAMIDVGADLTIQNRFGLTAAQEARQMGARDKAELLESAMKEHEKKQ